MSPRWSRRRALQYGIGGLLVGAAGCSSSGDAGDGTTEEPDGTDTGSPETAATTDESETETTASTESATATPEPDTGGTWASYHHDHRNTGYNPDTVGPVDDASEAWQAVESTESSATVVEGTVYMGSESGTVYALDAESGETEWTFESSDKVDAAPVVADGTVVFPNRDGILHAVSAEDGTENWRQEGIGGGKLTIQQGSAAVADGVVYQGSMNEDFYGFDLETGEQVLVIETWPDEDEATFVSTPAIVGGTAYAATEQGWVYAIEVPSGTIAWQVDVDGAVYGSPSVADGVVYAPTLRDGQLFALDAGTGETIWTFEIGAEVHASPLLAHDAVFLGAHDNSLHAIEQSDGTRRWQADVGGDVYASAAADAERVYAGSYGQVVSAVDPDSGEVVWTFEDGVAFVDGALTVADGTLYFGARTGNLKALRSP